MITTRGLVYRSIGTFIGMGGLVCCLTLLFLEFHALMAMRGACFDRVVGCPQDAVWIMPVSILGGAAALGVYALGRLPVGPRLSLLVWPALFLSLGWGFMEAALAGPGFMWGFLICAVLFTLMGGGPLFILDREALRKVFLGPEPTPVPGASGPSGGSVRWTTSVALPGQNDLPRDAVDLDDPPQDRPTYPPQDRPAYPSQGRSSYPQDAPSSDAVPDDLVGRLERLAVLHQSGRLDDDEYAAAKARLLNGSR
ncbi:SHOCT domain-containing protein [Sphaerisporangium sp. NPDC051011]|uniref:SHOCT domain-containing protein n=1 Tax=Sphaerisporangium sp. NPDC051011 TaxID=3155792 RepID=UPI0033F0FB84